MKGSIATMDANHFWVQLSDSGGLLGKVVKVLGRHHQTKVA
jgi:hypothetical protein